VIVIGLGGNLGGEAAILARFTAAAAALAAWGPVRASRVYRSAPLGPPQPHFLNAALAVTAAPPPTPDELVAWLRATERGLGRARHREARWGPRPIDLDVLLWDDRAGRWPGLEVPHPRLAERRFALAPLADLVGAHHRVPGRDQPVGALLAATRDQEVEDTALVIGLAAAARLPP
jgi:2-amino-4-hydroxy-6-hydroxymethyldihydropteridine diphosphokinase